jgi:hypothetical protein
MVAAIPANAVAHAIAASAAYGNPSDVAGGGSAGMH